MDEKLHDELTKIGFKRDAVAPDGWRNYSACAPSGRVQIVVHAKEDSSLIDLRAVFGGVKDGTPTDEIALPAKTGDAGAEAPAKTDDAGAEASAKTDDAGAEARTEKESSDDDPERTTSPAA